MENKPPLKKILRRLEGMFSSIFKNYISAWSIRLPFENERDSSKYHWLILKSVSIGDRISKRMEKTLPAPLVQVYKTWSRKDIRELIGEMMDMAKQRGNQIKGEFCLSGSQLEKAVDRFILSLMHFSAYTATDSKVRLLSFL